MVKNLPAIQETWFNSWVKKIPWRTECLPTPVFICIDRYIDMSNKNMHPDSPVHLSLYIHMIL